jgi:hypothetical protein
MHRLTITLSLEELMRLPGDAVIQILTKAAPPATAATSSSATPKAAPMPDPFLSKPHTIMPAKPKNIASAEKRQIKTEMKTIARAHKKMLTDSIKAANQATKELMAAKRKYDVTIKRIDTAVPRETAKIERRMAILEGRLHS